jgi:hypothetical protein
LKDDSTEFYSPFFSCKIFIKAKPAAEGEGLGMVEESRLTLNPSCSFAGRTTERDLKDDSTEFSSPFSSCKIFIKAKPAAEGEGAGDEVMLQIR